MKKKKNKKSKFFLKYQREIQKKDGFFDGRFVSKVEDTGKDKSKKKKINKNEILKDLD